jgi:hypothetical protein
MKVPNWKAIVQDRTKWKGVVKKTKVYVSYSVREGEEADADENKKISLQQFSSSVRN